MDETRAPVLDPGAKKTKIGYFWALARDERPWSGTAPPGVAFTYAPGRGVSGYCRAMAAAFRSMATLLCDTNDIYLLVDAIAQLALPSICCGVIGSQK